MKYLKVYEDFYYVISSENDKESLDYFNNVEVTNLTLDIKGIFSGWNLDYKKELAYTRSLHKRKRIKRIIPKSTIVINLVEKDRTNAGKLELEISKLKDEWYKLTAIKNSSSISYRCDQYDGLLRCLGDTS